MATTNNPFSRVLEGGDETTEPNIVDGVQIFGASTGGEAGGGMHEEEQAREVLELAEPAITEFWTPKVVVNYPNMTNLLAVAERQAATAAGILQEKLVGPPYPILQAREWLGDDKPIGLVELSYTKISEEEEQGQIWVDATADLWRVRKGLEGMQTIIPLDKGTGVAEMVNFVSLVISEAAAEADSGELDSGCGLLLESGQYRKLNPAGFGGVLLGTRIPLDQLLVLVQQFVAEGGPAQTKYKSFKVPLDEEAFRRGELRSKTSLGGHAFVAAAKTRCMVDAFLMGDVGARELERGRPGFAILEKEFGKGVILGATPDKRDLQGLDIVKAVMTIQITQEAAVRAKLDQLDEFTKVKGPKLYSLGGVDTAVGWAVSLEKARHRRGAEPAGLRKGAGGAAQAAALAEVTAKMAEMSEIMQEQAKVNTGLQTQVAALAEATDSGRKAQAESSAAATAQVNLLAESLNGFIEYSKGMQEQRLTHSNAPTVRLVTEEDSTHGRKRNKWCEVEVALAIAGVGGRDLAAIRAAAAIIWVQHCMTGGQARWWGAEGTGYACWFLAGSRKRALAHSAVLSQSSGTLARMRRCSFGTVHTTGGRVAAERGGCEGVGGGRKWPATTYPPALTRCGAGIAGGGRMLARDRKGRGWVRWGAGCTAEHALAGEKYVLAAFGACNLAIAVRLPIRVKMRSFECALRVQMFEMRAVPGVSSPRGNAPQAAGGARSWAARSFLHASWDLDGLGHPVTLSHISYPILGVACNQAAAWQGSPTPGRVAVQSGELSIAWRRAQVHLYEQRRQGTQTKVACRGHTAACSGPGRDGCQVAGTSCQPWYEGGSCCRWSRYDSAGVVSRAAFVARRRPIMVCRSGARFFAAGGGVAVFGAARVPVQHQAVFTAAAAVRRESAEAMARHCSGWSRWVPPRWVWTNGVCRASVRWLDRHWAHKGGTGRGQQGQQALLLRLPKPLCPPLREGRQDPLALSGHPAGGSPADGGRAAQTGACPARGAVESPISWGACPLQQERFAVGVGCHGAGLPVDGGEQPLDPAGGSLEGGGGARGLGLRDAKSRVACPGQTSTSTGLGRCLRHGGAPNPLGCNHLPALHSSGCARGHCEQNYAGNICAAVGVTSGCPCCSWTSGSQGPGSSHAVAGAFVGRSSRGCRCSQSTCAGGVGAASRGSAQHHVCGPGLRGQRVRRSCVGRGGGRHALPVRCGRGRHRANGAQSGVGWHCGARVPGRLRPRHHSRPQGGASGSDGCGSAVHGLVSGVYHPCGGVGEARRRVRARSRRSAGDAGGGVRERCAGADSRDLWKCGRAGHAAVVAAPAEDYPGVHLLRLVPPAPLPCRVAGQSDSARAHVHRRPAQDRCGRGVPLRACGARWAWFMTAEAWNSLMHALHGNSVGAGMGEDERVRVWQWNARRLAARAARVEGNQQGLAASVAKLTWLRARVGEAAPDVICLQEVMGTIRDLRVLRRWFRKLGYETTFFPGEGRAGVEGEGGEASGANGMVWAVRREFGRVEWSGQLAFRVCAIVVREKGATGREVAFCALHGLHTEVRAAHEPPGVEEPELSFRRQLRSSIAWLKEKGGGLLVGDMNHVACCSMRAGCPPLCGGDRALRDAVGHQCSCCPVSADHGNECVLISARDAAGMALGTRRWFERRGEGDEGWVGEGRMVQSTLDVGIAVGGGMGWLAEDRVWAQVCSADGELVDLSDHALLSFVGRWVGSEGVVKDKRPLPIRIALNPKSRRQARLARAYRSELRGQLELGRLQCARAESEGFSATHCVVKAIRTAAETAQRQVLDQERDGWWRGPRRGATAKHTFNLNSRRVQALLRLRKAGEDVRKIAGGVLFHGCAKLRRMRDAPGVQASQALEAMLRFCRREVRRAGAIRKRCRDVHGRDRALVEGARMLERSKVDAAARAAKVAALVRDGGGGGTAMTEAFELDDLQGKKMSYRDPEFCDGMGRIGDHFVQQLDDGCCEEAYAAWCRHFGAHFTELEGVTGGEWIFEKELNFRLFRSALSSMARRKAVGAGGLTIELLLAGGREVQHMLYLAIKRDACRMLAGDDNAVSPDWRRVMYVLLKKKPPDDPRQVSGRREIALMPQDLKLFLQMLKLAVYRRVAPRVCNAQLGWSAGYGCTDAGLVLQALVQQARRTESDLYVLYLDLCQFFPRVQRKLATVGEYLQGLPRDVARLALLIYGGYRGDARATQCQYDSAAGLCRPFANWMGWLMGCVLSPDKARLLLNSIALAIRAKARGVRLWGFEHAEGPSAHESAVTWRAVEQLLFGDDWMAVCASAGEVVKVWEMWMAWEAITGTKVGVKLRRKTVLTGVGWRNGKAVPLFDPGLRLSNGGRVPMMSPEEAYPYLGRLTRADGDDCDAWSSLKQKFKYCERRLAKVRPGAVTQKEFVTTADTLYGGVAGFYLQNMYISYEQAEFVERGFRRVFKRLFGLCNSTPSAIFYEPAERSATGMRGRVHVWQTGLAVLHTAVERAMADVHDTPQRAAARSMVALSLERAGCCGDPNFWSASHLVEALEAKLRGNRCRYLGDGWLLADALIEQAAQVEECAEDAFAERRAKRLGRWERAEEEPLHDPLRVGAAHFRVPQSLLLFEPAERGGLGITPELILLEAGVKCLGAMCCNAKKELGDEGAWCGSFGDFRRRNSRVPGTAKAAGAWKRVMEHLTEAGVPPCRPEAAAPAARGYLPELGATMGEYRGRGKEVDVGALRGCTREGRKREAGESVAGEEDEEEKWRGRWEAAFGPVDEEWVRAAGVEWHTGSADPKRDAALVHVVRDINGNGTVEKAGGEAQFLQRRAEELGDDGFFLGWEEEAEALYNSILFDVEGYPCDVCNGARLTGAQVDVLPPLLQLECRARLELGDVPVYEDTMGAKLPGTHVCRAQQRRSHRRLCEWQARLRITLAYSVDASQGAERDEDGVAKLDEHGRPVKIVGRAAVRHDGRVSGGRLPEVIRANSYSGELVAHLDAGGDALIEASTSGVPARVAVVFDARSPVTAEARFRRVHDRIKQGYYCSEMLDTWKQVFERQETLLQLWQTSHVGDPTNEWADVLAGAALRRAEACDVPAGPPRFFSMRPSRPPRTWLAFARGRVGRVVHERLRARVVHTVMFEEGDIMVGQLPSQATVALQGVLTNRCFLADERRQRCTGALAFLRQQGCPCCGQVGVVGTWSHYAFFCPCPQLTELRAAWAATLREGRSMVDPDDINQQWRVLLDMVAGSGVLPHVAELRGAHDLYEGAARFAELERLLRGAAGGVIQGWGQTSAGARAAARAAVLAGAELFVAAFQRERTTAGLLRRALQNTRCASRCLAAWRWYVAAGGPARRSALRELRCAKEVVVLLLAECYELGPDALESMRASLCRRTAVEHRVIDTACPWRGQAAILDWSVVRALRAARLRWMRNIEAQGGRVRAAQSPIVARLLLAVFGRTWLVTPPPYAATVAHGPAHWKEGGADARVAAAQRCWRELGGLSAWRAVVATTRKEASVARVAAVATARREALRRWGGIYDGDDWFEVEGEPSVLRRRLDPGEWEARFRRCEEGGAVRIGPMVRRRLGWTAVRQGDFVCVDGRFFSPAWAAPTLSGEPMAAHRAGLSGRVLGPGEQEVFDCGSVVRRRRWRSVVRGAAAARGKVALPGGMWTVERVAAAVKLRRGGILVLVVWAGGWGDDWLPLRCCSGVVRRQARELLPPGRQRESPADDASTCPLEVRDAADESGVGVHGMRRYPDTPLGQQQFYIGRMTARHGVRMQWVSTPLLTPLERARARRYKELVGSDGGAVGRGGAVAARGEEGEDSSKGGAGSAVEEEDGSTTNDDVSWAAEDGESGLSATDSDESWAPSSGGREPRETAEGGGRAAGALGLLAHQGDSGARTRDGGGAAGGVPIEQARNEERAHGGAARRGEDRRAKRVCRFVMCAEQVALCGASPDSETSDEEWGARFHKIARPKRTSELGPVGREREGRGEDAASAQGVAATGGALWPWEAAAPSVEDAAAEGRHAPDSGSDGGGAGAEVRLHHMTSMRNSRVYAAECATGMCGLFTLAACRRGDVLVEYTGELLTLAAAKESVSEYLMDAKKVAERGSTRRHNAVLDGQGHLGGFANYAHKHQANAAAFDVLGSVLRRRRLPKDSTAVLLIATRDLPAGCEVRFDYDDDPAGEVRRSTFREAMIAKGTTEAELDSGEYLRQRWRLTADAMLQSQGRTLADCRFSTLADTGAAAERELLARGYGGAGGEPGAGVGARWEREGGGGAAVRRPASAAPTPLHMDRDAEAAPSRPPPSPPPSPPALRRSGVLILPACQQSSQLLTPLRDIFRRSSAAAAGGGVRHRGTDILWHYLPNGIREVTIVPESRFWEAFRGDPGAMTGRAVPPRGAASDFWAVADYAWGATFLPALERFVVGRAGLRTLDGLLLSGIQAAWSPPGVVRELHFDQSRIARLLVTFTYDGDGTIRITGAEPDGDPIDLTFQQADGDGYCLYGHGVYGVRHGTTANPQGRWAITIRFSQIGDARVHRGVRVGIVGA